MVSRVDFLFMLDPSSPTAAVSGLAFIILINDEVKTLFKTCELL